MVSRGPLWGKEEAPLTLVPSGETPIVGTAPAVGNAIFDAAGVRLRDLPMIPNGLKA